jgi:hypothetical protein
MVAGAAGSARSETAGSARPTRDQLGLSIVPGRPDGRLARTDRVVDDARVITPNCSEHLSHRDTHRLF